MAPRTWSRQVQAECERPQPCALRQAAGAAGRGLQGPESAAPAWPRPPRPSCRAQGLPRAAHHPPGQHSAAGTQRAQQRLGPAGRFSAERRGPGRSTAAAAASMLLGHPGTLCLYRAWSRQGRKSSRRFCDTEDAGCDAPGRQRQALLVHLQPRALSRGWKGTMPPDGCNARGGGRSQPGRPETPEATVSTPPQPGVRLGPCQVYSVSIWYRSEKDCSAPFILFEH